MFWHVLFADIRWRLRWPALVLAAGIGFILTVILIVAMADEAAWGSPAPGRFLLLPLVTAAVWFWAAWLWFTGKPAQFGAEGIGDRAGAAFCQTCGFNLAGHNVPPTKCPECGAIPSEQTWRQRAARRVALIPAVIACLAGVALGILALLYFSLWSTGGFDI